MCDLLVIVLEGSPADHQHHEVVGEDGDDDACHGASDEDDSHDEKNGVRDGGFREGSEELSGGIDGDGSDIGSSADIASAQECFDVGVMDIDGRVVEGILSCNEDESAGSGSEPFSEPVGILESELPVVGSSGHGSDGFGVLSACDDLEEGLLMPECQEEEETASESGNGGTQEHFFAQTVEYEEEEDDDAECVRGSRLSAEEGCEGESQSDGFCFSGEEDESGESGEGEEAQGVRVNDGEVALQPGEDGGRASESECGIDESEDDGDPEEDFDETCHGDEFAAGRIMVAAGDGDVHEQDDDFRAFPGAECGLYAGEAAENAERDVPEDRPDGRFEKIFDTRTIRAGCRIEGDDDHGDHARDQFFDGRTAVHVILNGVERPGERGEEEDESDASMFERDVVVQPGWSAHSVGGINSADFGARKSRRTCFGILFNTSRKLPNFIILFLSTIFFPKMG